jgi:hypothetical protein
LFVAIGPSSPSTSSTTQSPPSSSYLHQHITSSHTSASPSLNTQLEREHGSNLNVQGEVISGAVSEAGSVGTQGSVNGASIWGVRRQAEDVGRYLEGKLEGFVLSGLF